MVKIRDYLQGKDQVKTSAIADSIGLSPARTRAIIAKMDDLGYGI